VRNCTGRLRKPDNRCLVDHITDIREKYVSYDYGRN
jgi:hypothetical protein